MGVEHDSEGDPSSGLGSLVKKKLERDGLCRRHCWSLAFVV